MDDTPAGLSTSLSRTAKITTGLLFLTWLVDYFDRMIVNLALPHIGATFSLNHAQQGTIISAFFLAYAFCQLPGGVLADRFGTRTIIAAAMIFWSLFTGLTAIAWSFTVLLGIRFLFGVGEGVFPAASMKAITERTGPNERMTANGLMLSSNPFGSAVAPLVAGPLITLVGWRFSFFWAALAGLACCAIVLIWLPRPKQTVVADPQVLADSRKHELAADSAKKPVLALFRSPIIFVFALMFFGVDTISWGLQSWMPSYLQTERGLDVSSSGLLVAIPSVFGGVGTIVGGKITDKINGRPAYIVVPAMIICAASLTVMAVTGWLPLFIGLQSIGMFCFGVSFMPVMSIPLKTLSGKYAGSASGTINFGGQLAGFFIPIIMGTLIDLFGYVAAFLSLAVGALIALVASASVPQTPNKMRKVFEKNPYLEGSYADTTPE